MIGGWWLDWWLVIDIWFLLMDNGGGRRMDNEEWIILYVIWRNIWNKKKMKII